MARWATTLFLLLLTVFAVAQDLPPSPQKWSVTLDPADARAGESARLLIRMEVPEPWYIYGLEKVEGPIPTIIKLKPGGPLEANGELVAPPPVRKFDKNFDLEVGTYAGTRIFALPVKIKEGVTGAQKATVLITSQSCNETTCDIPRIDEEHVAEFTVGEGAPRDERLTAMTALPDQPGGTAAATTTESGAPKTDVDKAREGGLLGYVLFCFAAGIASLLLPCVFPMIPITVSFFSKRNGSGGKPNLGGAFAYCLGIIGTFTGLGLAVTLIFGATGVQDLATNAWVNMGMFILFVVLALSLFGVFNFQLPSGLVNAVSSKSRMGGVLAPVLMGLTFTLTSFTCTVPVVGTLLVAATKGDIMYPLLGMIAFSTAFSLPFFFLALFPSMLEKLPRSGVWMNTVKVFMGFLELAFAVKFLSNVDLVFQWGLITRPIALAIWSALAFFAAVYLLGWIKLPKDPTDQPVGWLRRGFGVATVAGGVLCLAAIEGYPLGRIGALLPPDPYPGRAATAHGLPWSTNYEAALAQAKSSGKPVFINFTGVTCTNCRWMEQNMFPRADVRRELNEMVLVELYTDQKTEDNKRNQQLQQKLTGSVTLPVYAVVSPDGSVLNLFPGSTEDPEQFIEFLRQGKQKLTATAAR